MEYKFKTNINCGGCVASVKPFLDKEGRIKEWEVDTNSPDKVLKVKAENIKADEVENLIKEAGFEAKEKKKRFGFL